MAAATAEQRNALESACGELRDKLTSLRHFDRLIGSVRIGPKAVAEALADMHSACAPLVSSGHRFLDIVEGDLGAGASGALATIIAERGAELERALEEATPLNAARRLKLELVSGRCIQDLDAALVLVELLREVTVGQPTLIHLVDLIHQGLAKDPSTFTQSRLIKASVSIEPADLEVASNPRAIVLLSALSAAFVTSRDDNGCHISVARHPGTKAVLSISPGTRSTPAIELSGPRLLKSSKACADSAARALGLELAWTKTPRAASLIWAEH